jgi:hypothetical protein
MTNETLKAVARAITKARWIEAYFAVWPDCDTFVDETWRTNIPKAQAAIDAMPSQEWQPIEIIDVVRTGLRMSVRLEVGDELGMLRVTYDGEGFRLDFSPEQLRDIYNAVGEALPEPPEKAR